MLYWIKTNNIRLKIKRCCHHIRSYNHHHHMYNLQQVVITTSASGVYLRQLMKGKTLQAHVAKGRTSTSVHVRVGCTNNMQLQPPTTTCNYNNHHHWPDQDQHGCRWSDQCCNQANLQKACVMYVVVVVFQCHSWITACCPNASQNMHRKMLKMLNCIAPSSLDPLIRYAQYITHTHSHTHHHYHHHYTTHTNTSA